MPIVPPKEPVQNLFPDSISRSFGCKRLSPRRRSGRYASSAFAAFAGNVGKTDLRERF
jgi:hypothetical protein